MATELIRYDAMCQAIAEAYKLDEVKDIRDRFAALEHYARQARNVEAERQCCEIRLRAEKKWGRLRKQTGTAAGRRTDLPTACGEVTGPPTLADLGVTERQSEQWQRLAEIPDDEFEAALAGLEKPTISGIINGAKPKEITPVSDLALWLWGRLRDFERHQLLPTPPVEVLATMTPEMLSDVAELAPRVAAWLNRIGRDDGS